ncbi:MAG: type II secretion system protein [Deltaproteobacteria bacterium]|nr:type II secretion system protein [Deltaproteobacteria bacterium]
MSKLLQKKSGFTLIELMIVVAIIGILAALAVPAFISYVRRSKTGEATQNLNSMFKAASSYYSKERTPQGLTGASVNYCVVASGAMSPADPSSDKKQFAADANFAALDFTIGDFVYYGYGLDSAAATSTCGTAPASTDVYTMYAHGDLDGDDVNSTFELAVGTSADNELIKSGGFFIQSEIE